MSEQLKQNIGQRVKSARRLRGLTQAELADAIDKAFETISNIERGKTAPNFMTLSDIAEALDVPLKDFFDVGSGAEATERQDLVFQISALVGQLDDSQLRLLLRLASVLNDPET